MTTAVLDRPADWHTWPPDDKRRLRRRLWQRAARFEQRLPTGEWRTWYLQGGRGSGKTRGAAEAFAELIEDSEPGEWGIVAPTYGDGRDVCMEGPSGLLQALGLPRTYAGWNRSMGELRLPDGTVVYVDGADDGALRVQGKNLRGVWCDEVGLWRRWDLAWRESIAFAVRLAPAKIIASGTPKEGHGLVKLLTSDPDVRVTKMRTYDNAANLSPSALAELEKAYGGTRRGRQELDGELLLDTPGALWTLASFERPDFRMVDADDLERVVVAIDPAVTSEDTSDESGIVVAGRAGERSYVLEDLSLRADPHTVATTAVRAYHDLAADRIVVEGNNGGDWLPALIRTVDASVRVDRVTATRGKALRAQPVAGLYEQGRVHHVGHLADLEEQMCSWTPESRTSPDRLDALVWALTALHPELGAAKRRRSIVMPEAA
ncbi:MAG: terminase large subunit domain-containing protein [Acidimicrobiales bacterium]